MEVHSLNKIGENWSYVVLVLMKMYCCKLFNFINQEMAFYYDKLIYEIAIRVVSVY